MTDSPETRNAAADPEWLVFACVHCHHPLKIRAAQAGGTFRCPSCQQELTAPETAADTAKPRPPLPDAASEDWAASTQTGLAVDRLSGAHFRSMDDPSVAIPSEGIRVRKRKRRSSQSKADTHGPSWEAEATEAPATTDWDDSTTTVTQKVLDDGSVVEQRKRHKRREMHPAVTKTWNFITRVGSLSLIALGVFILVGAAVAGWYLARSRAPVVAQAVEKEVVAERFYPSQDEGEAAVELVQRFLAADTVEDKLPLVRFPEKVKPLMDLWYKGRPDRAIKTRWDELSQSLTKFIHVDGTKFVVVTLLVEPEEEYRLFAVESTADNGLKVDWETAVGWQAMTVEEFMKGKPTTPQPFRVQAAPGDYYNGAYSDESVWCAVNLTYPRNPDFNLYGYVERNTPTGDRLMQLLGYTLTRDANGKNVWEMVQTTSKALVLAIAFRREGSDPKQVTIHEVLHEEWFLKDGPAVGNARKSGATR